MANGRVASRAIISHRVAIHIIHRWRGSRGMRHSVRRRCRVLDDRQAASFLVSHGIVILFLFFFILRSIHYLSSFILHFQQRSTLPFFFALIGLVASFIHPLFPFPSLEGLSHRLSILPLMTPLLPERGGRGDSILPHSLDAPHGRKVYKQRIYTQKNNLSDRHLQISSHLV